MVETVLLATPRWSRDGGVGAHVQASAAALARHGVRVAVAAARVEEEAGAEGASGEGARGKGARRERPPGVTAIPAPRLFDAGIALEERLGGALSIAPDVVHLHQLDDPALVAALRAHAPVVTSAHAYTACASGVHYFRPGQECTRAHGPGCAVNFALRGCAHTRHPKTLPAKYRNAARGRAALAGADLAVSYSRAVDLHLAANGIERRRIVPLFPTLPPPPVGRGSASGGGIPGGGEGQHSRRRVLFAGRISAPKGVDVLLRAAREVEAELAICGDGRHLEAMRRLARRLQIDARVRFTGWLGAEALARELADAAVVAIPSRWPEPFGLVGIEALAAGRPVVASLAGGVRDWLEHGVTGLGVPSGDARALARALEQLLADPERAQAMGGAGREAVAARFSPECHVKALIEGYEAARARWAADRPTHGTSVSWLAEPAPAPEARWRAQLLDAPSDAPPPARRRVPHGSTGAARPAPPHRAAHLRAPTPATSS